VNKQNYTVYTPTATIGIRGTGGVIAVAPNGATTLFGTSGTWDLRSQTGTSIPVSAGQTGRVNTATQPAEQATAPNPAQPAPAATAQPQTATETFATAENRSTTGASEAVSSSSGGGAAGLVAPMLGTVGSDVIAFTDVATNFPGQAEATVTLSGGAVTAWTSKNSFGGSNSVDSKVVGGSLVESGTTGPITWGRIVNATVNQLQTHNSHVSTDVRRIGSNGGLYFATGASTVDMPKTGSFTYSLIPGAQPRPSFRSESAINVALNTFNMTGTFTATGGNVVYNMVLVVNGQSLSGFGSGGIGGTSTASNAFSASGGATGAFCGGTCMSSVSGAFFGPGASHAAAGYTIFNANTTDGVGGLANLQKQ
jgi:hypothetical protein